MKILAAMLMLSALVAAPLAQAAGAPVPSAVVTDPAPDATHPPRSAAVVIASHGSGMNGLFYLAGGPGPHPTVVLLHGFPGNEQNLDLAQAIRRAGWNVLTLHYRGSWGSAGVFSIQHVQQDVDAALAFIRQPATATRFGIDTRRIVLGGHSMGGFASVSHARHDQDLLGVFVIDGWNVGRTGEAFASVSGRERTARIEAAFDDLGTSLHGATAMSVAREVMAHRADWNFVTWAGELTRCPLLVIGAVHEDAEQNTQLAEAVSRAGGKVTALTVDTDHSFQDHRIALAGVIVDWLQALVN